MAIADAPSPHPVEPVTSQEVAAYNQALDLAATVARRHTGQIRFSGCHIPELIAQDIEALRKPDPRTKGTQK